MKSNRTDPTQGAYNGFSLADRFAAGAWAKNHGLPKRVPPDWPCAVCGEVGGQIGWHNEDYRTPVDAFAVCAWCHWALHSRLKPNQRSLWPTWKVMLRDGKVPPRCPWGTRWATFGAKYLRTDHEEWDWVDGNIGPTLSPFVNALTGMTERRVPWPFRIVEGDDHLPGQFNSVEATGSLQVFNGFVPPLTF